MIFEIVSKSRESQKGAERADFGAFDQEVNKRVANAFVVTGNTAEIPIPAGVSKENAVKAIARHLEQVARPAGWEFTVEAGRGKTVLVGCASRHD